jgi:hypothetical protein
MQYAAGGECGFEMDQSEATPLAAAQSVSQRIVDSRPEWRDPSAGRLAGTE